MDSVGFTVRFVNKINQLQTVVLEPWTGEYGLAPGTSPDIVVEGQPVTPLEIEIDTDRIRVSAFESAGALLTAYRNGSELRSENNSPGKQF